MNRTTSTFPADLGISTRVGLTRGICTGRTPGSPWSFGDAEARYREERMLAIAADRRRRAQARARRIADRHDGLTSRRRGVSRWTTWLPSVLLHRSSPAPQSSSVCAP